MQLENLEQDKYNKKNDINFDIAVIGWSAKFPEAENIDEFWQNLKEGKEALTTFNQNELLEKSVGGKKMHDSNYIKTRGIINNIDYFDAMFFDYNPNEALIMDPQIRLFHEACWQAVENAGCDPYKYPGLIGLYAGAANNLYWSYSLLFNNKYGIDKLNKLEYFQLINVDYLATKIAYQFDFTGPAIMINTACSTSLVTIYYACQALIAGECDMALAGGVNIKLPQKFGYLQEEGSITSFDGHCRAFDANSKGTVWSNGLGVVVLKRFNDAIKDKDNILAVIKGSAVNNDGKTKIGYTAPSIEGQTRVIKDAFRFAQLDPNTVTYIEAHGTGTELGDPIEVEALKRAFNTDKKQYCGIGSVKTNIGHANTAAGVAGFIKTVLALQHKLIPPSLNYEKPNPKIDFKNSPFYVVTKPTPWKRISPEIPLRAGVSSFGIGGTNAHVILEEAPELPPTDKGNNYQLIILSAKTPTALETMAANLADYLSNNPKVNLADVAFTLQVGRAEFKYRRIMLCKNNIKEAVTILNRSGQYLDNTKIGHISDDISTLKFQNRSTTKAQQILEQIAKLTIEDKKNQNVHQVRYVNITKNTNQNKANKNDKQYIKLLHELGFFWLAGAQIDWSVLYQNQSRRRLPLPTYPFERKRYWPEIMDKSPEPEIKQLIAPEQSKLLKKPDVADWFYVPTWERSDLDNLDKTSNQNLYLVFTNENDFNNNLINQLKQINQPIITVKPGKQFSKLNNSSYTIDLTSQADYVQLFKYFTKNHKDLTRLKIVHAWQTNENDEQKNNALTLDKLNQAQDRGLYSLIYLTQALEQFTQIKDIEIDVITTNLQLVTKGDIIQPEKSTILGPIKVIPQEYPNIKCRSIDITQITQNNTNSTQIRKTVQDVIQELNTDPSTQPIVAYRDNQRYIQSYQSIKLEKPKQEISDKLRQHGTYLITGGLGAIGLTIAQYLAKTVQANLILIGRTKLPDRKNWNKYLKENNDSVSQKIKKIQELEQLGATVFTPSADVANLKEMTQVVRQAEQQLGQINGVVHAAGVMGADTAIIIPNINEANTKPQTNAKIAGLLVLNQIFSRKKLDFYFLISSISAVLGGIGLTNYSAANLFLNYFVQQKQNIWQSINFDRWNIKEKKYKLLINEYSINPEEGIELLRYILSLSIEKNSQLIISTGDLQHRINQWIHLDKDKSKEIFVDLHPRPDMAIPYLPPKTEMEKKLAVIWQEVLGIKEIGVNDNFFEIGGSSLNIIQIAAKIKYVFKKDILIRNFFNYPTIKELSRLFNKKK